MNRSLQSRIISLEVNLLYVGTWGVKLLQFRLIRTIRRESSLTKSNCLTRNRLALCNNTARINANYGGPYLQTQQTILETQHNIFETQVNICETQHKISESQDKIVETHNKVVETQHKIIETQHKIVAPFRKLCLTAKENHVACQTRLTR